MPAESTLSSGASLDIIAFMNVSLSSDKSRLFLGGAELEHQQAGARQAGDTSRLRAQHVRAEQLSNKQSSNLLTQTRDPFL